MILPKRVRILGPHVGGRAQLLPGREKSSAVSAVAEGGVETQVAVVFAHTARFAIERGLEAKQSFAHYGLDRLSYPRHTKLVDWHTQTWLGHISINDRGCLARQWAWRTRTGSAPPRLPTSRAKLRFLSATSIITSRPRTRLARRSSS